MKVLVLRFSSIGDIVLISPVLRCLKQQLGAEVHVLTKKAFAAVLEANPHTDRLWTFEKEVTECLPALKQEQYDLVLDLHHNLRSLRVKLALRRPTRTFDKLNFKKWLLVRFGINRLPDKHIVERYIAPLQDFGVKYDGRGLDYFIPEKDVLVVEQAFPGLSAGQYFALAVGAAHATKQIPVQQMADLCLALGQPVVLLGGKNDREKGQKIAELAGPMVRNACGQLSLHGSASVIGQSRAVCAPDTGLMHIAAALKKPLVSVWGNTVPAFGMYPLLPEGMAPGLIAEVPGLKCRPCSKLGHDVCPQKHFSCMQQQDMTKIAGFLLAEKPKNGSE
jgi:ADP-heptose:LPS heptosyltransferase